MKKKSIAIIAMATCIGVTASFTGCSLVSTISRADMAQGIATVDITKSDKFNESDYSGLGKYSTALSEKTIYKRDLVSYFLNVGYSYVQQGYSYEYTFNLLMDLLVSNAVLVQYSTLELLKEKDSESGSDVLAEYNAYTTDVEKYEYLLGEDSLEVKLAQYGLWSSINSAIDSYEKTIIEADTEYAGTDTRTTPVNLNTEQEDYYPATEDGSLNYNVYTGFEGYLLKDSGAYQDDKIEGTTRSTRLKAYNSFINNLHTNNLIEDEEVGTIDDILNLGYIQKEYASQLETQIINKYYDLYESEMEEKLLANNNAYLEFVYNQTLESQKKAYKTSSAFETALSSMSDSSFILYSPDTSDSDKFDGETYGRYGFVYNILLPFSAKQSAQLSELSSMLADDDNKDYYYQKRNELLKNIQTEDQRSAWFNGTENYSFKVSDSAYTGNYYNNGVNSEYLFFEGNLTDSEEGGRYEKLTAYIGEYPYNGRVQENTDGSYTLLGNKLDIDGMLAEFSAYINYVLGGNKVSFNGYNPAVGNKAYYEQTEFLDDDDEVDYSNFLYASGKVNFSTPFNNADLFNPETEQYKAMSAVNELQFAYTTDTSVLSQYVGYSVSAYDTNYIKEFEYAAKLAVSEGAGAFTVCAGDYGWHLIYVTYAFDFGANGEVYSPDWDNVKVEGTFENLFLEWLKSRNISDVSTTRRSRLINDFYKDDVTVIKYQSRYQDLLDLDN